MRRIFEDRLHRARDHHRRRGRPLLVRLQRCHAPGRQCLGRFRSDRSAYLTFDATGADPGKSQGDIGRFQLARNPARLSGQRTSGTGRRSVRSIVSLLARIDPARFRFAVKNRPSGDKDLQGWMKLLGAALVINGSYFSSQRDTCYTVTQRRRSIGTGGLRCHPRRIRRFQILRRRARTSPPGTGARPSQAPTTPWYPFRC